MRFTKSFALLAVLALSLTPFVAHATPKADQALAMPNLMVDHSTHASATSIAIVNAGSVATGTFHIRIERDGVVYSFAYAGGLAAGQVLGLQLPPTLDGKPCSISIALDSDNEVPESDETDNVEVFNVVG